MLPEDEFRRLLERERARAERSRRSFVLVEFDTTLASVEEMARVLDILKQRRRLTDDIGWVRKDAIGVVLPETDATGGSAYLADVHRRLREAGCTLPSRLYVFKGQTGKPSGPTTGPRPGETPSAFRRRAQDRDDAEAAGEEGSATPSPSPSAFPPADPPAEEPGAEPGANAVAQRDMMALFRQPLPRWKRLGDLAGAIPLLVLVSPVMLLVAILVKATSRGPVIFRQWRAGPGGNPFVFYKFRTMIDGADAQKEALRAQNEVSGPVFKIRLDPRVTPLGRVLRRTSLDELPQLWNVIKGDMTLVGPRPPTLDEVPKYEAWHARRLDLTGGITGLWQVSGRSEISFEEWMRMDIRYSRTRSPLTDIRILLRTVRAVLSGRGAT